MYILQEPLHTIWQLLYADAAADPHLTMQPGGSSPIFGLYLVLYLLSLWLASAAFATYVEEPLMRRVVAWRQRAPPSDATVATIVAAANAAALVLWACALAVFVGASAVALAAVPSAGWLPPSASEVEGG